MSVATSKTLTLVERRRRAALIESYLTEGFTPLRILGGKGSATEQADKADRKASGTYARWVRDEERRRNAGKDFIIPDWSKFTGLMPHGVSPPAMTSPIGSDIEWTKPIAEETISPPENTNARSDALRLEITTLIQSSIYPVINPEAIVVESATTRRYSPKTGEYKDTVSTPRTYVSETLRVHPVSKPEGRKFLFTAAQNDGQLHKAFWVNLKAYATDIGAEIVVGPLTYETSWFSENNPVARSYPNEVLSHLCFGQMEIGDNFVFCGEMNTLATAAQPISDLVTYSRNRWAVFPHPKRQLKSVPSTDPDVQSHHVMTTGCCTKPKLIPRKAGIKALFHSVIGAVLVEFDDAGDIFCRQITATEDGSFYDLNRRVEDGCVSYGHRVRALVCGDIHLRKIDPVNAISTFGFVPGERLTYTNSLIDTLDPENIVLHDVFDNESRNHHHVGDNAYSYEMALRGRDSVEDEVCDVAAFLKRLDQKGREVIVAESNHDIGLDRYVREGRYRSDPKNIRYGMKLEQAYLDHRENVAIHLDWGQKPPSFSLLEHAVRDCEDLDNVSWAYDGTSRLIDGIEVGHHGFRGVNGSKGTVSGFARTGRKLTIGDKHSPEIAEGCFVAGVMTLQQGYNKGPSTWAVSHVLQYADGHRAIVTIQNGKWQAKKPRYRVLAASEEV